MAQVYILYYCRDSETLTDFEQIGWFYLSLTFNCSSMLTILSFVPAESATLGIVDKSTFSQVCPGLKHSLTSIQSSLVYRPRNLFLKYLEATARSFWKQMLIPS